MTHATHAIHGDFSFAAAIAEADLDAEIAVYTADIARSDFIYYSLDHNGFVFGDNSAVYQSYTAADAARAPQPTPPPTPAEIDEVELCADCRQPADDRCYDCRIDICTTCNDRFHRHGQPAAARRNGAAFFDRQRAVAAFRKSTIEPYLFSARNAATELHGDIGDAAYSERVQAEADELFN